MLRLALPAIVGPAPADEPAHGVSRLENYSQMGSMMHDRTAGMDCLHLGKRRNFTDGLVRVHAH